MKKSIIISSLLILIATGVFLTVKSFVTAQVADQGLEVSPPSQEVTVTSGEKQIVKAKIRNKGNSSLPIQVHIEDFTAKGDEGQVELTTDSPYSVVSWTKVSPTSFTLGPDEEKEVTATISVPANAAGGRFGSFIFAVEPDKQAGNNATVSQEIASLFLVKVAGTVKEDLSIKNFSAPSYSEFGPVPFDFKFANNGNVHVKVYGLINVTDMFGKKVADIVVPGVNIFPQAERIVTAHLDKQFLFGPYTATALLYYGSETQSINATTSFFVFPTRIVVGGIVVLFVLFLMRKRLKKSLKALFG